MTLNRWDPLRDLLNFQERVSRLIDASARESLARRQACWSPVADILETPDAYVLRAELPGVGRDNINIEVRGNLVRIYGERALESEPAIAAYHSIERVHGMFERTFTLPGPVDMDRSEAKYEDGMLEVNLPKSDEVRERSISVVCLSQ
ncbi:MAG: Hsp20/alpha crystallin family protein [Desulfomonilaceae bacterium]|nr:Hsp20/alpha crystallin family protein [Desulfomonilaceae bacterium]